MNPSDQSARRIAWWLAGLMLLSFAFGVAMYLPAEHRAQKIQEFRQNYQARQSRVLPAPAPATGGNKAQGAPAHDARR